MDAETTVVVVEDDPDIADLVGLYLRGAGFRVLLAADGERGLAVITQHRPALAILDVGLPGIDGFELYRRLQRDDRGGPHSPAVLFLTARDDERDRVLGFELGADDYVTKPFSPRELVARVRAILRRAEGGARTAAALTVAGVDNITVDADRREVRVDGAPVALTAREFDLLVHLVRHPGIVLTRTQLLEAVWGPGWYGDRRTVDVHVAQLRKKVGERLPLATVWGVGYRLA